MTQAKFYIYRNLHKNCFSVRYKGKVIEHATEIMAYGVTLKVNEAGRQRVIREKQKNVHAFVVADSYYSNNEQSDEFFMEGEHITYNPYRYDSFVYADNQEKVSNIEVAHLVDNKIYEVL